MPVLALLAALVLSVTPKHGHAYSTYVVSFFKPVGPIWFTLRLDRRTLLPRDGLTLGTDW